MTDILSLLDQLRAIALEGVHYSNNPHDTDRYTRLLTLSASHLGTAFDYDQESLKTLFANCIGVTTPRCGADAAIKNQNNQLLVLRRADDNSWCLPCGWVHLDENFAEAAAREVLEETGLVVKPQGYISITKKGPADQSHLLHQINGLVLMHPITIEQSIKISEEHTEFQWISAVSDIADWHFGHQQQALRSLNVTQALLLPCDDF